MPDMDNKPHPPADHQTPATPPVREALDAEDVKKLQKNPASKDGKLDVAIDESFPASDPPSQTQPAHGKNPPPSTGGGD